jgi:hypothetical protein
MFFGNAQMICTAKKPAAQGVDIFVSNSAQLLQRFLSALWGEFKRKRLLLRDACYAKVTFINAIGDLNAS